MANTNSPYTPEQIARVALSLVRGDLVLSRTVNRDYEAEFTGGVGFSVNVRKPATLTAREQELRGKNVSYGSGITTDRFSETVVPVSLDKMIYSAIDVSDEDLTLNLEDFSSQVLAPQITAVAEGCENAVVAEMQSLTADEYLSNTYDAENPNKTFVAARKELRDLRVPASNLYAAVGTGVYADLLNSQALRSVAESGSDDALADATVGRLHGFTVIECNRLDENEMIFYHRDAFTLAVRAPRVPEGVAFGASVSGDGFAMRYIRDYDSSLLADRSVVSTIIGTQAMTVVRQDDGSEVTPAIRVLAPETGS